MATKVSKPSTAIFVTGVRDSFKTVDAYKQKGTTPITSVTGLFEQAQADLVGALRGGKQSGVGIPLFGKIGLDGKISINKDALVSRALTFGASLDIGKAVSSTIKFGSDGMVNSMLGTFNTEKEEVYVIIDGVKKPLEKPAGILSTINSIGQSINAFTGVKLFKVQDASGQEAFLKSLIVQGLKDGIPNTFKALTKNLTDPKTIRKVAGNVLGDAVKSFDIKSLVGDGGMGTVVGRGGALLRNPMISRELSGDFAVEASATTEQLKDKLSDIKDFYLLCEPTKAVEGPETGNVEVHYASAYSAGNSTFKKVVSIGALGSDDADDEERLVAAAENSESVTAAIKRAAEEERQRGYGVVTLDQLNKKISNISMNPDSQIAGTKAKTALEAALAEKKIWQGITIR